VGFEGGALCAGDVLFATGEEGAEGFGFCGEVGVRWCCWWAGVMMV
jgi:hypothetical protein